MMRRIRLRKIAGALAVMLMLGLLGGCKPEEKPNVTSAAQMNDAAYAVGVPSGSTAATEVQSTLPKAKIQYFNSLADGYLAVQQGKIDAFAFDRYILQYNISSGLSGVKLLDGIVGESNEVAIGISRHTEIPDLQGKIDAALDTLRADGTLDEMFKRWVINANSTMPDIPKPENPTMQLNVATSGLVQPYTYYDGNTLTGHDLELIARLALLLNAQVEIKTYDYNGFPAAMESGAIDCVLANLNATKEYREVMDFSTPIYLTETALLIKDDKAVSTPVDPLESAKVGVMVGSTGESYMAKAYPGNTEIRTYQSNADSFTALEAHKVDYVITAYTICQNAVQTNSALAICQKNLHNQQVAMAVAKSNTVLLEKLNAVISKYSKDGTLDEIGKRWIEAGGKYAPVDIPVAQGKNGVLRVATSGNQEPFTFVLEGKLQGSDCELIERIAYELDMTVEYQVSQFSGLIAALASGKADVICSAMAATEERKQSVDFTDPYLSNPLSVVCRAEDLPPDDGKDSRVPVETARLGQMIGSVSEMFCEKQYPDAQISIFNNHVDSATALSTGKLDYCIMDYTSALRFIRSNKTLEIASDFLTDEKTCMGVSKKQPQLYKQISKMIDRYLEDGTIDEMISRWIKPDGSDYEIVPQPKKTDAPVIKVAITSSREPTTFMMDGAYTGMDIELIDRVLYDLGYQAEYIDMEFSAIIASIESGHADMTIGIFATPERAEKLLFTAPYFSNPLVLLARKAVSSETIIQKDPATATYGILSDVTQDYISQSYPAAKIQRFPSALDALLAMQVGKVDYVLTSRVTARHMMQTDKALTISQDNVIDEPCHIAVDKGQETLQAQIDALLTAWKGDGSLDALLSRWVTGDQEHYEIVDVPKAAGKNGVLKVAIFPDVPPVCFIQDGEYAGINVELIERLAYELDRTVEFSSMDLGALLPAIQNAMVDLAIADINATDERRAVANFTQSYFDNPQVILARETAPAAAGEFTALSEISGKNIGVQTGAIFDTLVSSVIPNVNYSYYNSRADILEALNSKKVDGAAFDKPVAELAVAQNPNFVILAEQVVPDQYGICLQKGNPLTDEVNRAIAQLRDDGTLETIRKKWLSADESAKTLPTLTNSGANGVLRVAHDTTVEPMCYIGADGIAGFDLELMLRIGQLLERTVEFTQVDFGALIPMVQSGKADAAVGCMSITDERKQAVDMSDPYYEGGIYIVVRKAGDSIIAPTEMSFLEGLRESFIRTFVVEDRWKLVLDGLGVTVLLSVFSGLFGSILGFGICMLRRSKHRGCSAPMAVFIRIVQGTPIVVMLMILYYIVFGSIDISAIAVAILGFSIYFGVYSSEMMRAGIDAVDKGQIEAAHAIGFTHTQTFWKITFPQAARHFLPVFEGEFISMVKMTSVVGYIAIQDLTKVSDIIRSRTLEAFFPLIATAVIYFVVANVLILLISHFKKRLDPKRRKRTVKGVVTE